MEEKYSETLVTANDLLGCSFITVTLKPEYYTRKVKVQFSYLSKATAKLLKQYCDKVKMIPELTKKCNIHIHAIVKWTTRIDYPEIRILDDIKTNKYIGIVHITPQKIHSIESANRTWQYMIEDYDITRKILGLKQIIASWQYEVIDIKERYIIDNIDNAICEECEEIQGVEVIPEKESR